MRIFEGAVKSAQELHQNGIFLKGTCLVAAMKDAVHLASFIERTGGVEGYSCPTANASTYCASEGAANAQKCLLYLRYQVEMVQGYEEKWLQKDATRWRAFPQWEGKFREVMSAATDLLHIA